MGTINLSDYTASKQRVVNLCNTVGYSYTWKNSPSGVGAIATAATINELQNVTAAAGGKVVTAGCNNYCGTNCPSNYKSFCGGRWEAYWGTDSGYNWKS